MFYEILEFQMIIQGLLGLISGNIRIIQGHPMENHMKNMAKLTTTPLNYQ